MYVYVMYDNNGDILYVGKTIDMKTRITQHFGSSKEPWKNDVKSIKYMDCYTEVDMSIYEIFLINTLKPKYNKCLLYKGETFIDLMYELKDYNINVDEDCFDVSEEEKNRIKQYLIINEDKGKSKLNSNYDSYNNIKYNKNSISSRWCDKNKCKYERVIKNIEPYFKRIAAKNKDISMSNLYISIWSNHINPNNKLIKKFKKYINNFKYDENIKVICYLRNDYVPNDNEKHNISDKKSIMKLVNILRNSAIKNNEVVYAYIPSSRMRNLLKDWLNNEL